MFPNLLPLLHAHPVATNVIGWTLFVLFVLAIGWGLVKIGWQYATGKPMPRNKFTVTMDVVCNAANNLWGVVNVVLKALGFPPLFLNALEGLKERVDRATPKVPPLACLFVVAFIASCSAARSRLVDVTPTTPGRIVCVDGANRCNGLVPEMCLSDEEGSSVMRWWPLHPLSERGTPAECAHSCVVDDAGVAACAE